MSTRTKDAGGQGQVTGSGGLRGFVEHNPVVGRLLTEAKEYAQARGERVIHDVGERVNGVVDRTVGGSPVGEGVKEMVKGVATGEAPTKSLLSGAAGAVKAVFGKGRRKGAPKSTNIIEDIDVGVPVSVAYNQWTQFQEFASFMKGVEGVDQMEEVQSNWRLKIGLSRRSWKADVGDQIPDRRITWTSQGAKGSTKGVVSFHPLADDLTRVILVMEYTPAGPVEKVGNMMRLQLRRVRLDLREYKKFVSMQGEETGAWRGEIRDGEVVSSDGGGEEPEPEPEREGAADREAEPEGADQRREAGAAETRSR